MSWKPCRGARISLDKAVNDSQEYYYKYFECTSIKDKSKAAFRWLKADIYLGMQKQTLSILANFIDECKTSQETYKPFLNLIKNL